MIVCYLHFITGFVAKTNVVIVDLFVTNFVVTVVFEFAIVFCHVFVFVTNTFRNHMITLLLNNKP